MADQLVHMGDRPQQSLGSLPSIPMWLIPMAYVVAGIVLGFTLPRLEDALLPPHSLGLSISSVQAFLSAVASGMMALTGVVYALAIVLFQFSVAAYSPRLALSFISDRRLFHAAGIFAFTFLYSLAALAWVDRHGAGQVPLFSVLFVLALLIASMLIFSILIQRLSSLQIANVLEMIGDHGREVIEAYFGHGSIGTVSDAGAEKNLAPVSQTLVYDGKPRVIASFDLHEMVRLAEGAGGTIEIVCAVGDTLVCETKLLHVHGGTVPEEKLMRAIRLEATRTFEQDPKFALRLLVDIAIKALSPAINDPTTAVQALDQIEDLLGRLGRSRLEAGEVPDASGRLRVIVPVSAWEDYLALGFDEIRQYGATSIQVVRRLRAALAGLEGTVPGADRQAAVRRYMAHLDTSLERSVVDVLDLASARQEDRQGLGVTRKRPQGEARAKEPEAVA